MGLSQHYINFGDSSLQSKAKRSLVVENYGRNPTNVVFSNTFNYSVVPNKVKIGPN